MGRNKDGLLVWDDEMEQELFTPDQIAENDLISAVCIELIEARNKSGISQRKLAEMSGLKQPVIARLESGYVVPRLDTLLRLLLPLGKTLAVVPLKKSLAEYAAKTAAANAAKTAEGKPDGKKPRRKQKTAKKASSSGRKAAEKPADAVHATPASHGSGYPAGYSIQAKGSK